MSVYSRYPEYRASGVDWLGEVPAGWGFAPLWTLFRRVKRQDHGDEELLSVYRDYGVIPKASRADNFNKPSEDLSSYQLVCPGDLVINKMKAWQGSVAISEFRGIVSPAYHVLEPLHDQHSRFLHYLFRSKNYTVGYMTNSKGIRVNQWDLEPQKHTRMPVLLPQRPEQRAIATFIDSEIQSIDGLINEQNRLIETLQEKRQAVISHAVTKGLNPDAPMKPSGAEWLGEVPAHWEVVSVKHLVDILPGYAFKSEEFSDENTEFKLLRGINVGVDCIRWSDAVYWTRSIEDVIDRYSVRTGDVVVGLDRPWISSGTRIATISQCDSGALVVQRVARLRSKPLAVVDFVKQCLSGKAFSAFCEPDTTGVSVPHISTTQIGEFRIGLPPEDEIAKILVAIKKAEGGIDRLVRKAEDSIALLEQRRNSLISAAVTGKIDVRNHSSSKVAA